MKNYSNDLFSLSIFVVLRRFRTLDIKPQLIKIDQTLYSLSWQGEFLNIFKGIIRILDFVFVPCVEPDLPGAFLTEDPAVLVAEGRYNQVPMIIGGTSGEANIAVGRKFRLSILQRRCNCHDYIPMVMNKKN